MTIETLRGRYRLHRFPPRQRAVTGEPLTTSISAADYQRQLMDGFQEGLQKGFAQGMTEGQEQGFSEGHQQGFAEGRRQGYTEGSLAGQQEGRKQFVEAAQPLEAITGKVNDILIGESWLGRVVNGLGEPLDGKGRLNGNDLLPPLPPSVNPLTRRSVDEPLDVGVKAINGLLTIGKGQRVGLMAGSGVGKSVLLGMITRQTKADIVVVGLIGERGREVKEFIDHSLGADGLAKSIVVVAPADESPLMRLKATELCHSIAAWFRDRGHHVLLLVDFLTRYAMAQREIALSLGEPPATKGYPPSAFGMIPKLVESAGNSESAGSMTAIYTVLAEGDDQQDPIVDCARAVLDGHIVLTRKLAEAGHYPAIDIGQSISRCMNQVTSLEHQQSARALKQNYAAYMEIKPLIPLGGYVAGADASVDKAVKMFPAIERFLRQEMREPASLELVQSRLQILFPGVKKAEQ